VSASHLDIAPRHAGVVFGVGNSWGTLAGLISVPAIGLILKHTGSWSVAFAVAAAHNIVGAALWARWVGDTRLREDGGATESEAAAALAGAAPGAVPAACRAAAAAAAAAEKKAQ
jgi:ACS family sodium-dependent inorganic phosphate cotransporter